MEKIKIMVRFDDICPTMNWNLFVKAIELMDKHNAKALLGIIPDCADPDLMIDPPNNNFWEIIRGLQKRGYTIAMHGYRHVFDNNKRGIVNKGFKSEFAGHPYNIQYEKIRKGKNILESHGIYTDIFFAPAHSYDNETLKALSANGFKYLSDGRSSKPYVKNGIMCIPCRTGGISSMRFGIYHVAVIHVHEWKYPQKKVDKEKFENLLNNYSDSIVDFEEFIKRDPGWLYWQKITEYIDVFYMRHIKPMLIKILKKCKT